MATTLPSRLLFRKGDRFFVDDARSSGVTHFDIISYRWGEATPEYDCGIEGVTWPVTISQPKLNDIKRLMISANVSCLWVDCVCINQADDSEKSNEIAKMYEYYKGAQKCHILIDLEEVWKPEHLVGNLKFIDHILSHMGGAALASEAMLTENMTNKLTEWANRKWAFPMDESAVSSAAIEMGVLNCYSTCINHVRSLFDNLYFSRVWTFQEMLLGKNITMWGINPNGISCIGELHIWMDLATDAKDKAYKLQAWIEQCRVLKSESVNAILRIIEEDNRSLGGLQTQVQGISSARTDIINGGPRWWHENHKGISNIFSAVSIRARECSKRADIFRGLLGVFSGLFTKEEIERDMLGEDIETISFAFFKQLSVKTQLAWTRLAISSRERGGWDWIPVTATTHSKLMTTDVFAGVVNLGRLKQKGLAKAAAMTGILGVPRQYMKIALRRENTGNRGFHFAFRGCNCGKSVKTGLFSTEPIPTDDQCRNVVGDETGRILVQCATILGSIMDPGGDVVQYRRRLLGKLQPQWHVTGHNAKPTGWIDRCVSGTSWENPHPQYVRAHNRSMNYSMVDIFGCESRLENDSTENIVCEVRVNCGCTIVAPFSLVFGAITAVSGSFLGDAAASLDADNRIVLQDGLGLVQVGDVGRTFHLVAFGGDIHAYESYASSCRSTKVDKPVVPKHPWPRGRALVREEFRHSITDVTRDYGYVETGGSGNLLICRSNPIDNYRIIGVCIDEFIANKRGIRSVTIR